MAGNWIGTGRMVLRGAGLGGVSLLLSTVLSHAQAVDVTTTVSSINDSGAIELVLPKDSMVAIGDKVEFDTPLSGKDADGADGQSTVEWSVQGLGDGVIIAEPSAKPENMPEQGYRVTIKTLANQPMILSSSEAKIKAAEVNSAEPEIADATTDQMGHDQKAPVAEKTETAKPSVEKPSGAEAADAKAPVEETSEPKTDDITEPVKPEEPSMAKEPAPEASAASQMAQPEEASKPTATLETTKKVPEKASVEEKADAPLAKEPEAPSVEPESAEPKATDPVAKQTPVAPAPEMACDRMAAHPFDPDAVAKGVFYADLDADKVIAACQDAIAAYPQEARFYTQLTRGLHKAGKPALAHAATQKGADLGSGQSMAYLGVMYKNGEQVAEDQAQALQWFEKAAEAGNPGGMVFAASMYRDGVGTARNYKRAAELYQMASDKDIAEASADLGIFYDRGQGVERSPQQAATLLLKAYVQDDKDTQQIFFEAPGVLSEETRKAVQIILKDKGFYKSAIDADFGSGTRRALILYKRNTRR
ncbi:Sel1 repeat-containing protein [Cohaesibacter marisflavi]|uniref:Sel1 repeat-containing protein n=1 Tax=Cohaesibacter marisflavi TaxID=655353 RepID=A0A1I4ZNY7_9HYPH|nr:tetratricopeptide repeat protein [Cohaesibacter marisflavi]SFN51932.1 Sel1 repeat-containing protein [Cohaesibacter marisflavi]